MLALPKGLACAHAACARKLMLGSWMATRPGICDTDNSPSNLFTACQQNNLSGNAYAFFCQGCLCIS